MPRSQKRLVMLMADALVLPVSLLAAAWLVTPQVVDLLPAWVWVIPVVVGLVGLRFGGAYRSVVRFMGFELVVTAFQSLTIAAIALFVATASVDNWPDGLRVSATFWLLSMVYVVGGRLTVRWFLQARNAAGDAVVIYGAGDAGAHLVTALRGRGAFTPVAFIDDNSALHKSVIHGLEVRPPRDLPNLIDEFGVSHVLLALPSVSRRRRLEIINQLEQLPVHVQTMPDTGDLAAGNARVDDIREVDITDLLGRDPVPPNPKLLDACIRGKSVMVTGAGGSIGSELCRQIAQLGPKRLVLMDLSEAALYTIDQALQELAQRKSLEVEIVALIGSAHHRERAPTIELDAHVVLLVFIPPLLLSAGWYSSPRELRAESRALGFLALALVLVTTTAVAVAAHALVDGLTVAGGVHARRRGRADRRGRGGRDVRQRARPRPRAAAGPGRVADQRRHRPDRVPRRARRGGARASRPPRRWASSCSRPSADAIIGVAVAWLILRLIRRQPDVTVSVLLTLRPPTRATSRPRRSEPPDPRRGGLRGLQRLASVGFFDADTRLTASAFWQIMVFGLEALLFILLGLQLDGGRRGRRGSAGSCWRSALRWRCS